MKISVIVPVYNVERELNRCIQSILNQTYRNLEIILVDDGSPDNCPQMCDEYAQKDNRVKVIHKENGGLSSARNVGLKAATGDYILYVDSDDYIELDSCDRLLAAMKDNVDFVVGSFKELVGQDIIIRGHTNTQENVIYNAREFVIRSIQKNELYAAAWLNLYRRDFLIENDLLYKEGILFEDTQLLLKLFFSANQVTCTNYPFYNYIVRTGSIMQSKGLEKKADTIVGIYNEWMDMIGTLADEEYKRYLYGIILRFYMRNCRVFKIRTWRIKGVDFWFAMKYALDFKERLKILGFTFMKSVYLKL